MNHHLDVSENEEKFWVHVRRDFGFNDTVTVEYDMWGSDKSFSRIEYRHETIVFDDQVREVKIEFRVFPRPLFELDNVVTEFYLRLEYPTGGAQLGKTRDLTIRYFDDESVFDKVHSYATILGVRSSD